MNYEKNFFPMFYKRKRKKKSKRTFPSKHFMYFYNSKLGYLILIEKIKNS